MRVIQNTLISLFVIVGVGAQLSYAANTTVLQKNKMLVDISRFCGSWRIKDVNGKANSVDVSSCTKSSSVNGFFVDNCDVKIDKGAYQFEIRAKHGPDINFNVKKSGEIVIADMMSGKAAEGGTNKITLKLVMIKIDEGGYTGNYGFEYVGTWGPHPIKECIGNKKMSIPGGSKWLFTGGRSWITLGDNGILHSTNSNSVEVSDSKKSLVLKTHRVLVYPAHNSSQRSTQLKWWVFESEKGPYRKGPREVSLIKGRKYTVHVKEVIDPPGVFRLTKDCKAIPNQLKFGDEVFYIVPLCN